MRYAKKIVLVFWLLLLAGALWACADGSVAPIEQLRSVRGAPACKDEQEQRLFEQALRSHRQEWIATNLVLERALVGGYMESDVEKVQWLVDSLGGALALDLPWCGKRVFVQWRRAAEEALLGARAWNEHTEGSFAQAILYGRTAWRLWSDLADEMNYVFRE